MKTTVIFQFAGMRRGRTDSRAIKRVPGTLYLYCTPADYTSFGREREREEIEAMFITEVVDMSGVCAIKLAITTNGPVVMKATNRIVVCIYTR